jgi:hypothetical protein
MIVSAAMLFRLRLRAGLRIGCFNGFVLCVNARAAVDPWVRELCRLEIERRQKLDNES